VLSRAHTFLDDPFDTCLVELKLQTPTQHGHVFFVLFDGSGRTIPPNSAMFQWWRPSWDVLRPLITKRLIRFGAVDYASFQFQSFTVSDHELIEPERQKIRELFLAMYERVRPRVIGR